MIRYNNLKIFILVGEAKPGGIIGAMLSPYLFSTNMLEFCKKFNDLTNNFNSNIFLNVKIYADLVEKIYSFYINLPSFNLILNYFFKIKIFSIYKFYDIIKYMSFVYKLKLVNSFFIVLGIMRSYSKKRILLDLNRIFFNKIK